VFEGAAQVTTVGLSSPVPAPAGPAHGGTWYAVLDIDKRAYKKWASQDQDDPRIRDLRANGAAYCVSVHALGNLRMRTGLTQAASPRARRCSCEESSAGGTFDLTLPATVAGVSRITVRAQGGTFPRCAVHTRGLADRSGVAGGRSPRP
jgi:hypothetical protein